MHEYVRNGNKQINLTPHNYALHLGQKTENLGKPINNTESEHVSILLLNYQNHQYHLTAISSHKIIHRNTILLHLVARSMSPQKHIHWKFIIFTKIPSDHHRLSWWIPKRAITLLNCNYFSEMVHNTLTLSWFRNIMFSLTKSPLLNCVYDNTIGV